MVKQFRLNHRRHIKHKTRKRWEELNVGWERGEEVESGKVGEEVGKFECGKV
jgi:hypothetical protein